MLDYIIDTTEGVYAGLEGRLSPKIIDLNLMRDALSDLVSQAMARGYSSITNIISHLFEFPTSLYKVPQTVKIELITHLPMYLQGERHQL